MVAVIIIIVMIAATFLHEKSIVFLLSIYFKTGVLSDLPY